MPYTNQFTSTDDIITHLRPFLATLTDASILSKYAGFISVSAITVYELAIKDIFNDFSSKKNRVFGVYTQNHFSRINGQIYIRDITGKHIQSFGDKYKIRFNRLLQLRENEIMALHHKSISNCYVNLVQCRHDFVHKGTPTLTVNEVMEFYEYGKQVLHCLNDAMKR